MVAPIARPMGEGGVSTISSAAGRNSSSSRSRGLGPVGKGKIFFSAFMKSYLKRQAIAPFEAMRSINRKIRALIGQNERISPNHLRLRKICYVLYPRVGRIARVDKRNLVASKFIA